MNATLRITLGVVFLILGVIGSLLPVLQGWLFFLIALLLFFPNHPKAESFVAKIEPKFPRLCVFLRRCGIAAQQPQPKPRESHAIMPADDERAPRS